MTAETMATETITSRAGYDAQLYTVEGTAGAAHISEARGLTKDGIISHLRGQGVRGKIGFDSRSDAATQSVQEYVVYVRAGQYEFLNISRVVVLEDTTP